MEKSKILTEFQLFFIFLVRNLQRHEKLQDNLQLYLFSK